MFGWGRDGEGLTAEEEAFVMARAAARFGTALKESASAPRLEDIKLEAPRVTAPASLPFCTSEHYDRAAHTYGKSYPELARGLARDYASAPDIVAYPRNEADVKAVLDWAGSADATVTPFGGGSSVCGGVEPKRNGHKGAVTIDLRQMDKVKEIDKTSCAALIEGGTYGPALEAQLRPRGPGIFWYTYEVFEDFVLSVAWRITRPDDNSGVFLRFPPLSESPQPAIERGYEVQIDDRGLDPKRNVFGSAFHLTGAIYQLAPAVRRCSRATGEWNLFEITARGATLAVRLNGQEISMLENASREPRGHIGLQNHHDGSTVQFRDLHVLAP
jgi:hypothetical protein